MSLWLYLFGVERRLCCSGSTCLAWRGGRVALALSILASKGGCVALAVPVWHGEEVVLLGLYLVGVESLCCSRLYLFGVERRSGCFGSTCLVWRGGRVALALSVCRRPEAA